MPIDSTASSATRLLAPMIEHGSTALSVEMCTKRQPWSAATCASVHVPSTLVCTASAGCDSRIGTCLCAAAWNTTSGSWRSKISRSRLSSRMSARIGSALSSDDTDLEQQAVVAVEEQQAGGAVLRDLAGDLAADRTAGAGDEHGGAFEVVGDVARVDRGVLAAEEVGEVEVAEVVEQRLAVDVGRAGEHLHLRVGLQRARLRSRCARSRDASGSAMTMRSMRLALRTPLRGRCVVPSTRSARTERPTSCDVVVDEPDDDRVAERAALELEREGDTLHRSRRR